MNCSEVIFISEQFIIPRTMKTRKHNPLILCILLLISCGKNRVENHKNISPNQSSSTQNNLMKTIKIKLGEEILIGLQNIPEYTWFYETKPDWIISMTQEYSLPFKSKGTNDHSEVDVTKTTYQIKTLKKGEVTIRFYAILAWETNPKPVKEILYKIVVE